MLAALLWQVASPSGRWDRWDSLRFWGGLTPIIRSFIFYHNWLVVLTIYYPIFPNIIYIYIWLVVLTILKNMSSSMGRIIHDYPIYETENQSQVWNHQPDNIHHGYHPGSLHEPSIFRRPPRSSRTGTGTGPPAQAAHPPGRPRRTKTWRCWGGSTCLGDAWIRATGTRIVDRKNHQIR